MPEDRKTFITVIPTLIKILRDTSNNPMTLMLACQCLCCLISKKCDSVFRKKVIFEADIAGIISTYLAMYDYEEKFILCCLDLFSYLMCEVELDIMEILYGERCGLFNKLRKFLEPTGVEGAFYSQRVIYIYL